MFKEPTVYAVKHKDLEIRMASRSGGIFTALSDVIFDRGGIVYGCILTEDLKAIHIRAERSEERDKMRGSKYVQSNLEDIFQYVKIDLEADRYVLFSGTSCQVVGLQGFLGKKYEKLYCVDIICHGVPSPAIWEKYIEWIKKKYKANIVKVDFRNKIDFGWRAHIVSLFLKKRGEENKLYRVDDRVYVNLFYSHLMLRPSCYKCPYKMIEHPTDITIADYWGIEKAASEMDDDKGISLVMVNNEKGHELFEKIKDYVICQRTRIEDSMQKPLIEPYNEPLERNQFWIDFEQKSFGYIAKQYGGDSTMNKFKHFIKHKLLKCL